MSEEKKIVKPYFIQAKFDGMRLDKILPQVFEGATFGLVQKLCRKGAIRLDGKRVKGNEKVTKGQEVRVPHSMLEAPKEERKVMQLSDKDKKMIRDWIIEDNEDYIVLNKPYGIPVQAGSGHNKSIDRYLEAYYTAQGKEAPKLVHRLDKTTTGCLVMAKTKEMAKSLSRSFQGRHIQKTYWAVVKGKLKKKEGFISLALEKEGDDYEKIEVSESGQKAESRYRCLDSAGDFHWVEVKPKTGRMHQIRVHLSAIHNPVVGDIKYGGERIHADDDIPSGKIFLHARHVSFKANDGIHEIEAPIPDHFKKVFKLLSWDEEDGVREE